MNGWLTRVDRAYIAVNEAIIVALMALMVLLVFSNVTVRGLFGASITGAGEVARIALVWSVMLGAGAVFRRGGHVAVTILHGIASGHALTALRLGVLVVVLAFATVMVWIGSEYTWLGRFQSTPVLRIPFHLVYAAIPLGGIMLFSHAILFARAYLRDDAPQTEIASS